MTTSDSRPGWPDIVVSVVLLAGLCLYFLSTATVMDFGADTSTYFELARSLRLDHRYWFNFEPHTIYPPGYPLLLAGLMSLVGESFGRLVRLSVPIYFVGLASLYLYVRLIRGSRTALAVVVLVVTSFSFFLYSTLNLFSDAPYLTVSILALLCFELGVRAQRTRNQLLAALVVGALASYLLLIRSIGVTFTAALVLWMVNPNGWGSPRWAATCWSRVRLWFPAVVLPIVVFGAWTVWASQNKVQHGPGDYMDTYAQQTLKNDPHQIDSPNVSLKTLPSRTLAILADRMVNATRMVFNAPGATFRWSNPVVLVFFLTVIAGWGASVIHTGRLADWYLLTYTALLLFYPFGEGIRYLFPLHPFLIVYAADGLDLARVRLRSSAGATWLAGFAALCLVSAVYVAVAAVLQRDMTKNVLFSLVVWAALAGGSWFVSRYDGPLSRRRDVVFGALTIALCGLIVVAGLGQVYRQAQRQLHPDPSAFTNALTFQVSSWVAQNTNPDAVIMNDEPAILHRLTRRRTRRFPLTTDPEAVKERIAAEGVQFLVVLNEQEYEYFNPSTMRRFDEVRRRYPRLFVPAYAFDRGTIYKVQDAQKATGLSAQ